MAPSTEAAGEEWIRRCRYLLQLCADQFEDEPSRQSSPTILRSFNAWALNSVFGNKSPDKALDIDGRTGTERLIRPLLELICTHVHFAAVANPRLDLTNSLERKGLRQGEMGSLERTLRGDINGLVAYFPTLLKESKHNPDSRHKELSEASDCVSSLLDLSRLAVPRTAAEETLVSDLTSVLSGPDFLSNIVSVLTHDSIHKELRKHCPWLDEQVSSSYAKIINEEYRIVFAILLAVFQPERILKFLEEEVSDIYLPIVQVSLDAGPTTLKLRDFESNTPPRISQIQRVLQGWSEEELIPFDFIQWNLLDKASSQL